MTQKKKIDTYSNFEQISHIALLFLFLTLNKQMPTRIYDVLSVFMFLFSDDNYFRKKLSWLFNKVQNKLLSMTILWSSFPANIYLFKETL